MNTIHCFWTGDNPITENRLRSLEQLKKVSRCDVVLLNKDDITARILPGHPLHPAYQYLSAVHKTDYMRTYFMHFYGGGYSDIKRTNGSWVKCFEDLRAGDAWVCGYREMRDGVAYIPGMDIRGKWHDLIGNCAYICKAQTPLTTDWYNEMIALLDRKLDALKAHPARHPRDKKEEGHGYPIEWNEMLGRIFHKICYKHKEKLLITLPTSDFSNYQ